MKQYTFLQELGSIDNILATTSMAALGTTGGAFTGKHIGNIVGNAKYSRIDPDTISWNDPILSDIVKNSLYQAKNNIKVAKEWYESCDIEDKPQAKEDYIKSINNYKNIQRDIVDRNPTRWLNEYRKVKINDIADRYKSIGGVVGTGLGGIGTALALYRKKG